MLNEGRDVARHCAVWGSPIGHSLSPVLHRAAYAALGLHDWSYDRREVDEAGFAAALAGLDATWVGLSLTMPLKEVAFRSATTVTTLAAVTGAANTLVRDPDGSPGWTAHNTDVHGITMALRVAGCTDPSSVLVVGSGATARAAIAAVSAPRGRVVFMVRDRVRPETLAQARQAGLAVEVVHLGEWATAADVDAVVSTVPPASVPGLGSFPEASEGSRRRRGPRRRLRLGRDRPAARRPRPRLEPSPRGGHASAPGRRAGAPHDRSPGSARRDVAGARSGRRAAPTPRAVIAPMT